ncbi:hypothetical protein B0I35DRAFT_53908 [Stachybotrys elegans]|uniref:Uncharacterized protein n=1 Tax=Stachybotrys elegans TaxID=80388 RepID=A0A8K0SME0_9HYPO|nr:hypothetical protein B0I35DRAFT_53908 [Stachybotrys elegans]
MQLSPWFSQWWDAALHAYNTAALVGLVAMVRCARKTLSHFACCLSKFSMGFFVWCSSAVISRRLAHLWLTTAGRARLRSVLALNVVQVWYPASHRAPATSDQPPPAHCSAHGPRVGALDIIIQHCVGEAASTLRLLPVARPPASPALLFAFYLVQSRPIARSMAGLAPQSPQAPPTSLLLLQASLAGSARWERMAFTTNVCLRHAGAAASPNTSNVAPDTYACTSIRAWATHTL